jgi:hypothetical protein
MPVAFVKAALMSSMAFFIDAAAKTVMVLSCASADFCMGSAAKMASRKARAGRLGMAFSSGALAPSQDRIGWIDLSESPFRTWQRTHGAMLVREIA